ncbi:MAG: PIN domain-containing protein [Dehalococcoidia bacterium]
MSADFLDTNVLIYLFDNVAHQKRDRARMIVHRALSDGSASISHQVVQEALNVITGKLSVPTPPEVARAFLDDVLMPLWDVMPGPELFRSAIEVRSRYGFSFYDALIVAAALASGSTRLYSEDFQHGQVIEGLTIENPFRSDA